MNFIKKTTILFIIFSLTSAAFGPLFIKKVLAEDININGAKPNVSFAVPELNNWSIVPAMPAIPVIIVNDIPEFTIEAIKGPLISLIARTVKSYLGGKFVSDWKGFVNDVPVDMTRKYIDANISVFAMPEFQGVLKSSLSKALSYTSANSGEALRPTLTSSQINNIGNDLRQGNWNNWLELFRHPQNSLDGSLLTANYLADQEYSRQSSALRDSGMAGSGMLHPLKETCIANVGGKCVSWSYLETVPNKSMDKILDELSKANFEGLYNAQSLAGLLTSLFQSGLLWDIIGGFNWGGVIRSGINGITQ